MKLKLIASFLAAVFVALAATGGHAATIGCCLIVSEVVDGDLAGGNPKFVEITNTGPTPYTFTNGGIIMQANANAATDLTVDVDMTGITIPALSSYVIASTANSGQSLFESTYGFAANLYTSAGFGNGDDRYIIAANDSIAGVGGLATLADLIDIYGENGVSGTGKVWEYTDSYAYRNAQYNTGNGATFLAAEWTFGGVAALDAANDPARIALLLANTTPGEHDFEACVPEPATGALMVLAGLAIIGICRRNNVR